LRSAGLSQLERCNWAPPNRVVYVLSVPKILANAMSQTSTKSIVDSWVAEATRKDNVQERNSARHPFARPATISNGGVEVRVSCRDLSSRGIGLIQTEMPAKQGDHILTIWLHDRVVDLDVKILWTKRIGRSWWASGGHLMITTWDATRLWWDRIRYQANDRRGATRYPFCQCFLVSVDGGIEVRREFLEQTEKRDTVSLASLDVSNGGIRFISGERFASAGRTLRVSREGHSGEPTVRGIVRYVFEMQNGYFATGVEFDAT